VEPPNWNVIVFGVVLTLAAVLLWPILLSRIIIRWTAERRSQREWEERHAQGLEFSFMGGMGEIACRDCGFRQEITSFMHGATSGPDACCDEGLQCLSCGKFVSVHREGNPPVDPVPPCECGGELSRDHFLFCPKCRSKNLKYGMSVIS
jgi:DNA-directed RNA polymerase subunit RPC12/RpoP